MKKIISFILILAMSLSMAACGGSGNGNTNTDNNTPKVLSDTLAVSTCDGQSITNSYSGLEFTLTDEWEQIDRDALCRTYMKNITGRQLEAMGEDELKQHAVIPDWAVKNSSGNVVLATLISYEKAGMTFEEYLQQFKETNTRGSYCVSDEKTVNLSGVEYQNITAFNEKNMVDICYKDRGDGHMAVIMSNLDLYCAPQYIHAFFNGGPDTETDIPNVPGLFTVDNEKWRVKNDTAGIEIDIPAGWTIYNKKALAELQYFTTEQQLDSMTPEDFAQLYEIFDIWMSDDENTTYVNISYLNRNHPAAYGLSAEDMQLLYRNQTNLSAAQAITYDNVSFAGQSYYCTKKYHYNADKTYLYLFREINKDYIAKVVITGSGDCAVADLRKLFDNDNDTEMLIKRSEYVEGKYQFHNRYTDVRINILKGWERNDQPMLTTLYGDKLTLDQLENWTDEDYMKATYIPDFAVVSEDRSTVLMAYYINLNKFAGEKADVNEMYDAYVTVFENTGKITVEEGNIYPRGGRDYMVYKSHSEDGTQNVQFATAEISDDYVIMLIYVTPTDSPVPDVTGVIHDKQ